MTGSDFFLIALATAIAIAVLLPLTDYVLGKLGVKTA